MIDYRGRWSYKVLYKKLLCQMGNWHCSRSRSFHICHPTIGGQRQTRWGYLRVLASISFWALRSGIGLWQHCKIANWTTSTDTRSQTMTHKCRHRDLHLEATITAHCLAHQYVAEILGPKESLPATESWCDWMIASLATASCIVDCTEIGFRANLGMYCLVPSIAKSMRYCYTSCSEIETPK